MTPGPGSAPRLPLRALWVTLSLAVALYLVAVAAADWDGVRRAAAAVPAVVIVEVFGLSVASYGFRFGRWEGLLAALGHRVPRAQHVEIYLSAFALTVTPGKVGELVRSVFLAPRRVPYPHSIAAFVCERTWDVGIVAVLSVLAVLAFPAYWPLVAIPLSACAVLVASIRSPFAEALVRRIARLPAGADVADAVLALRRLFATPRLAPALAWTVPAWAVQGLALAAIVHAMGHDVPAAGLVGIYCLGVLAGALSFIPAGLGTTEVAVVLLLKGAGLPSADAVYAALFARSVPLWLAIGIGVVAMWRASRRLQAV